MSAQKIQGQIVAADSTASGQVTAMNVDGVDSIIVQIALSGAYDGTIKCQGSASAVEPTWSSAASVTNIYAPKRMIDLDDNSSVTGSTGLVAPGALVKEFVVNVDQLRWLNFDWSGRAAGTITSIRAVGRSLSRLKGA